MASCKHLSTSLLVWYIYLQTLHRRCVYALWSFGFGFAEPVMK